MQLDVSSQPTFQFACVTLLHCPKNVDREPGLFYPFPFCDCLGPLNMSMHELTGFFYEKVVDIYNTF